MSDAIFMLRLEHGNIARVLDLIEDQVLRLESGASIDGSLVLLAVEYLKDYPEECHHPKEDLIFRKLRERAPEAAEIVGDLEAEHERIGTLARHFREAIQNVLDEVEVSRDAFDTVARHFIRDQRRHLQMEEERFFPLAVEKLTPGDWAEIDARITDEDDPVFGSDAAADFAALRNDLLQWEEEDEAEESD